MLKSKTKKSKTKKKTRSSKLDHFKFYKLDAEGITDTSIALKGQFDKRPKKVRIVGPALFANPVSKNRGTILDKNAHFKAYFILGGGAEPARRVTFENQFGRQRAEIGRAEMFLTPTSKRHKNARFPISKALDHFKCYRVERSKAVNKKVTLVDQFKKEKNVALRPVFFCLPVEKRHGNQVSKIKNERDHLVLYELEIHTSRPTFKIGTVDQFNDFRGEVYTVMWLGLPTTKLDVQE